MEDGETSLSEHMEGKQTYSIRIKAKFPGVNLNMRPNYP